MRNARKFILSLTLVVAMLSSSIFPNVFVSDAAPIPSALLPTTNGNQICSVQDFIGIFLANAWYGLTDYDKSKSVDMKDKTGAEPSKDNYDFVRIALARDFISPNPNSWNEPATKAFAAEFYNSMRGHYEFNNINVYTFDDTRNLSVKTQRFIALSIECGLFPMPTDGKFNPNQTYKRSEIQYFVDKRATPYIEPVLKDNHKQYNKHMLTMVGIQTEIGVETDIKDYAAIREVLERHKDDITMVTFVGSNYMRPDGREYSSLFTKSPNGLFEADVAQSKETIDYVKSNDMIPLFSIFLNGNWSAYIEDGKYTQQLLSTSEGSKSLAQDIAEFCVEHGFGGAHVAIEFIENLTREQHTNFIKNLSEALHAKDLILVSTSGAYMSEEEEKRKTTIYEPIYDVKAIGEASDYVMLLEYDCISKNAYNNSGGNTISQISNMTRIQRTLNYTLYQIPAEKILFGLGTYAIDMNLTKKIANNVSKGYLARVAPNAQITISRGDSSDPNADANLATFKYSDSTGEHLVSLETEETFKNRLSFAYKMGVNHTSFYDASFEDMEFFNAVKASIPVPRVTAVNTKSTPNITPNVTPDTTPDITPVISLKATPASSNVYINGENISFDAYNIEGNNYFKLRDLAYSMSGTEKQFDVTFNNVSNAINLLSNEAYTVVGGEMAAGDKNIKTPVSTNSKILLDDSEVELTAYNINGNNYFKLRDIGKSFDFAVDWDSESNSIKIDTSKPYTE